MPAVLPSFITECHDRIDAHCAPRGNQARSDRDNQEEKSNAREREPVAWRHAIQQATKNASESQSGDNSNGDARQGRPYSLQKNGFQDVVTLRSYSNTNSNLARALKHHMGDEPVQTNDCQDQRQPRETAD